MSATPAQESYAAFDHHGHSIIFIAMTSTLYTVICVGVIVFLLVVLGILIYFYCCRVKPYSEVYGTNTVRYSKVVHSDQSEDEKSPHKKLRSVGKGYSPMGKGQGKGHDASPRYSPAGSTMWPTVPVSAHLDISAGHLLLSYIEKNLRDQNKLSKEWEGLQSYAPESSSTLVASEAKNKPKNRYFDAVPYDHSRVKLTGAEDSDYINASFIVDIDPSHPKYIATQGPLQTTLVDFWQMVWDQNVSVVVMLTTLADMGLSQCCQYWPTSGVTSYGHFEVRLVSEHPHSEDYIIRSLYIKNTKTQESRTVTHFQYLTWTSVSGPMLATPLLEFRRKVNKAHSRQDPLLVHCSGGVGRTGTYILIDMALSRIQKGAKELNLAATMEHLRDQRPNMVRTKAQFEFALTALVEETDAMLKAASPQLQRQ